MHEVFFDSLLYLFWIANVDRWEIPRGEGKPKEPAIIAWLCVLVPKVRQIRPIALTLCFNYILSLLTRQFLCLAHRLHLSKLRFCVAARVQASLLRCC